MGDLSSQTRGRTHCPKVKSGASPNHWTAREFPCCYNSMTFSEPRVIPGQGIYQLYCSEQVEAGAGTHLCKGPQQRRPMKPHGETGFTKKHKEPLSVGKLGPSPGIPENPLRTLGLLAHLPPILLPDFVQEYSFLEQQPPASTSTSQHPQPWASAIFTFHFLLFHPLLLAAQIPPQMYSF